MTFRRAGPYRHNFLPVNHTPPQRPHGFPIAPQAGGDPVLVTWAFEGHSRSKPQLCSHTNGQRMHRSRRASPRRDPSAVACLLSHLFSAQASQPLPLPPGSDFLLTLPASLASDSTASPKYTCPRVGLKGGLKMSWEAHRRQGSPTPPYSHPYPHPALPMPPGCIRRLHYLSFRNSFLNTGADISLAKENHMKY